jgi:5-methylcytosine-specific restriction endonuclease McrA
MRTLLLTPWGTPTKILTWQDAIKMKWEDTADVVSEYEEIVCSPSISWKVPAVMRLRKMPRPKRTGIKFSRQNVYIRDRYTCLYCGSDSFAIRDLTYDHVKPRCRGGKTEWTNIVTSCRWCNSRKGGMTCEQANMFPIRKPVKPTSLPFQPSIVDIERAPAEWIDWLPKD